MLRMKSTMAALVFGAAVVGTTVAPAFAGEVTGTDPQKTTGARSNANSICAYSGQNDGNPPFAKVPVQSYGQDIQLGSADPHEFNPGDACGPDTNFNRTK